MKQLKKEYRWTCSVCNQEFETRRKLQTHRKETQHCKIRIQAYIKQEYTCPYCGRIKTIPKFAETNHEKHCYDNPNRIVGSNTGHSPTQEQREQISKNMKKAYREGRHNGNWFALKRNNEMSYPEKWLTEVIKNEVQDKDYIPHLQLGVYHLDFAWRHKMRCIEIDGEQHYIIQAQIESDKRKEETMKNCGWQFIRLRWSWMMKHKLDAIKMIKEFVDNGEIIPIDKRWKSKKELHIEQMKEKYGEDYQNDRHNMGSTLSNNEIEKRKNIILNSDINFMKFGWLEKTTKLLGIKNHTEVKNFIKRYLPELQYFKTKREK
jgi:very-short-patch-repair endonuclease